MCPLLWVTLRRCPWTSPPKRRTPCVGPCPRPLYAPPWLPWLSIAPSSTGHNLMPGTSNVCFFYNPNMLNCALQVLSCLFSSLLRERQPYLDSSLIKMGFLVPVAVRCFRSSSPTDAPQADNLCRCSRRDTTFCSRLGWLFLLWVQCLFNWRVSERERQRFTPTLG